MKVSISPEELNGDLPEIEGHICQALYCQEFWYKENLVDSANIVYLRISDLWYRLYFDHGLVFWRVSDDEPMTFDAPEIKGEYKLNNLGEQLKIIGEVLSEVAISPGNDENIVSLSFKNKVVIKFYGRFDDTSGWIAA